MSKYYYLVAGLPNIAFDDGKLPYTVFGFKEELADYLTKADKRLLEFLFLEVDNKNLLEQLRYPDYEPTPGGNIEVEELNVLIDGVKSEIESAKSEDEDEFTPFKNRNKRLPAYFEPFVREYLTAIESGEEVTIPWEDRLSSLYYQYAMKCPNAFLTSWFELNLNINNIFTAFTCRKYKLDREVYIVGDTDIANQLRFSNSRDFELDDSLDHLHAVLRIAEEPDLWQRELKIDLLKWEWLDEQTFVKVFDIESVLTYMFKLQMMERWINLDKATGYTTFRTLVGAMKKGSDHTLEEFKRNNKK